jgi:hypothetical protein
MCNERCKEISVLRTNIQRIPDFNINIFIYFWGSMLPKKEQGVQYV